MSDPNPAYKALADRLVRIRREGRPMGLILEMISSAVVEEQLTGGVEPRDTLLEFVASHVPMIHTLIDADATGGIGHGRTQLLAMFGNIPLTRENLDETRLKNLVLLETSFGQQYAELMAHRQERKARGLSEKTGSGKPEPKIVIRAAAQTAPENLKIGASRVGGMPDLPPDFQWPLFKERKIPFVAQLNLSEFPEAVHKLLPADGHLFAFALISNDHDHWPPPMSVVLHRGSATSFKRTPTPGDDEIWPVWRDQLIYKLLPAAPEAGNKKRESNEKVAWLFGKLYPGFGTPAEIADQLFADGDDWINLLAVESVGSMQWSDFGQLHFLIRRSALAKLDFSNIIGMACSS